MIATADCWRSRPPHFRLIAVLLATALYLLTLRSAESAVPRSAAAYRRQVTAQARQVWGLRAPVADFAAQLQAESAWNPRARSPVGAQGLAQFMPQTRVWACARWPEVIEGLTCDAYNPVWAIRAMVRYDRYLYDRVRGQSDCGRLWAALRAYNGGLGHWRMETADVAVPSRKQADARCGTARRARSHCAENLAYPRRILLDYSPAYQAAGWGAGYCTRGD